MRFPKHDDVDYELAETTWEKMVQYRLQVGEGTGADYLDQVPPIMDYVTEGGIPLIDMLNYCKSENDLGSYDKEIAQLETLKNSTEI